MTRKIHLKNQRINHAAYDLLTATPDIDAVWISGSQHSSEIEMKDADVINKHSRS